jgi:hypothetical protein
MLTMPVIFSMMGQRFNEWLERCADLSCTTSEQYSDTVFKIYNGNQPFPLTVSNMQSSWTSDSENMLVSHVQKYQFHLLPVLHFSCPFGSRSRQYLRTLMHANVELQLRFSVAKIQAWFNSNAFCKFDVRFIEQQKCFLGLSPAT